MPRNEGPTGSLKIGWHQGSSRREVRGMKGGDLLTGILIGTVIGGLYATHLATYVPLLVVILAVVFGLKFLGLR